MKKSLAIIRATESEGAPSIAVEVPGSWFAKRLPAQKLLELYCSVVNKRITASGSAIAAVEATELSLSRPSGAPLSRILPLREVLTHGGSTELLIRLPARAQGIVQGGAHSQEVASDSAPGGAYSCDEQRGEKARLLRALRSSSPPSVITASEELLRKHLLETSTDASTVITALGRVREWRRALAFLRGLRVDGPAPDVIAVNSAICAVNKVGSFGRRVCTI